MVTLKERINKKNDNLKIEIEAESLAIENLMKQKEELEKEIKNRLMQRNLKRNKIASLTELLAEDI